MNNRIVEYVARAMRGGNAEEEMKGKGSDEGFNDRSK